MSIVSQSFTSQQVTVSGSLSFATMKSLEELLNKVSAEAVAHNRDNEFEAVSEIAELCGLEIDTVGNSETGQA